MCKIKKTGGKIKLTLLSNKCLKYRDKSKIIQSSKIFEFWYYTLKKLETNYQKTKI